MCSNWNVLPVGSWLVTENFFSPRALKCGGLEQEEKVSTDGVSIFFVFGLFAAHTDILDS